MATAITVAHSRQDLDACAVVRERVFVQEQGLVEYHDFIDPETNYTHYLVVHEGAPVGTARMSLKFDGILIEHVAVLAEARGRGIGRRLMLRMIADSQRNHPTMDIVLKPQIGSVPFYESLGFIQEFAPFVKLGAERQQLRLSASIALSHAGGDRGRR